MHSASSTNAIGLAGYFQRPPLSVDNIEQSHPPHLIPIPVPTLEHKKSQGRKLVIQIVSIQPRFFFPPIQGNNSVAGSNKLFLLEKASVALLLSLLVGQL